MARTSDQLARLNRRMKAIPESVREAVKPALDKSEDELIALAKQFVAVDRGDLKDSIEGNHGDHELERVISAGSEDAFHAWWVEKGTSEMEAQPYFFPAYRLLKKRIAGRIKRAVGKAVREYHA
ncbi:HK97 gp10 family phage protein [Hoeflea sp. CAU 1731]